MSKLSSFKKMNEIVRFLGHVSSLRNNFGDDLQNFRSLPTPCTCFLAIRFSDCSLNSFCFGKRSLQ